MPIIVDTSAVLALYDEDQAGHAEVAAIVGATSALLVLSLMVVAEADYMLYTRLGAKAARVFAGDVVSEAFELADWTASDHASAASVIDRFGGSDYIGITDAANVVLADRYRTTKLLTLDQRHFRVLRPIWGVDRFTLLPYDADEVSGR
jgi:hypothetical protein